MECVIKRYIHWIVSNFMNIASLLILYVNVIHFMYTLYTDNTLAIFFNVPFPKMPFQKLMKHKENCMEISWVAGNFQNVWNGNRETFSKISVLEKYISEWSKYKENPMGYFVDGREFPKYLKWKKRDFFKISVLEKYISKMIRT